MCSRTLFAMAVSWAIAACQHGEPCFDLIEQKNFVYSGVADVTANGDAFIKAGGCEIIISGSDREHSRLAAHFRTAPNDGDLFRQVYIVVSDEIKASAHPAGALVLISRGPVKIDEDR